MPYLIEICEKYLHFRETFHRSQGIKNYLFFEAARKSTICFFTRLFYPHIGGVEKHVEQISKILSRQGYKIIIVSELTSGKKFTFKNIEHYQIPVGKNEFLKKFEIWRWLFAHKNLIKQSDIIHCHDVFFWYLPFRFLYPRKSIYTTFHGYETYPVKRRAIFVRKLSEKLSNGSVCIGSFMKKWYGAMPKMIIYGGVSVPLKTKKAKIPSALFIGRLDGQTGVLEYAKAVEIIQKTKPEFGFTIIGDGPLRKELNKKFKQLGFIDKPEKLFGSYRFAFVSRYLSILEAMAAKRLVFALYDNSLKKDYLLKTPFSKYMIVTGSANDLSKKVQYFMKYSKQEEQFVKKAYEWVKNQTWEHVVKQYLALWDLD